MENLIELENILDNGIGKIQEKFLQTQIGEVVDNAVNIGIKSICPDLIENQVIDIKDTIFEEGIRSGIYKAVSSAIDIGKSAIGIVTGKFENISQIEQAVKKGGLLDTVSSLIDSAIDFANEKGKIDKSTAKMIVQSKKAIINNVTSHIEDSLTTQIKAVEKLDNLCNSWKDAYNNRDLNQMEKFYKSIEKQLNNIVPLENTITKAREIENLQNIIVNNGGDFDISTEKLELAKIL